MTKTAKKTSKKILPSTKGERTRLQEEVRSLKRKLMVAERLRVEALSRVSTSLPRQSWDGKLLAAGVAHEFNNILGAADGHAEWALETKSPSDMVEALEVVRQACLRSLQITKSLQGLPSLREEDAGTFALSKVSKDLKTHFVTSAKKSGVSLEIDLPECDLYGIEAQLFEVLVNLVKNAFEALSVQPAHTARVEVRGQTTADERLKLLVKDNGPGIPEGLRERIFHPFFTTKGRMKAMLGAGESPAPSSGNTTEGGSGLGLFLSQSIIQKMGGRLEHLKSSPGTSFQISLPLASKRRRSKKT
ncbi:MAG: ATP-binding protein [Bdellovibrionota bacterium]